MPELRRVQDRINPIAVFLPGWKRPAMARRGLPDPCGFGSSFAESLEDRGVGEFSGSGSEVIPWTPKVCKPIVVWALFTGGGPFCGPGSG